MEKIKESIEKYKIDKMVFCLAYGIELIMVMIDKSALINPFEGRLFQITFALCLIKILMTKYNYRECLLMLVLGIIGFISYKACGRNDMIRIVAFVMAAKDIDIKRLFKVTLIVTAVSVLLLMLLSAAGVLGVNYVEADFRSTYAEYDSVERRYCYGLGHPNSFYCMLLCILLLALYVYWDKLRIYTLLIAEAVGVFFYITTGSRTGFIVYTLAIVATLMLKAFPKLEKGRLTYIISGLTVLVLTALSVISNATLHKLWGAVYVKLDRIFTSRFTAAGVYGNISEWRLFSKPDNIEYFDMGYSRLFYWYGWIPATLCIIAVLLLIYCCYKKKDAKACLMIFMLAVYTMFEAHIVSDYIARNYIVFILGAYWTQAFFVDKGREMLIPELFVNLFPKRKKELNETNK